jgi:hypothetical protein
MTLRRFAAKLPYLLALIGAAIFIAVGAGVLGSARADNAVPAQAGKTQSTTVNGTAGNDSQTNSGSDEGSIGSNGSDTGGTVLDGVGATENVDPGNRLDSARVIRQNVNDGEQEYARYCFKDDIQTLDKSKAGEFAVMGPVTDDGVTADDVRLDENHNDCVIAGFPSGTDVKSYTIAAVQGGVVKNRDGQQNVADSIALDNTHSTTGNRRTAGPDLVRVRISKDLNRAQFIFDENIDKGSGEAGSLGFYSKAGGYHTGSSVVSVYNKTVTVKFDSNDQVDTAARWFAKGGAVQDQNGTENSLGTTDGSTDAPDLTSVSRDRGDTQYDYRFDENVGDLDASDFVLYTNDGTQIQADDITTDGDVVHADFKSEIKDYPKDIVLAGVVPANADNSGDTSDSSNGTIPTIGEVRLGSSNATRAGRTTGPDLTGVSKNASDQTITLTFDEKLDDGNSDNADASGIYLATSDNRLVQADSIESIDGHKVYVKANKTDIKALEGVVVDAGTVTDKAGNDNALTSDIWGSGDTVSGSGSGLYSSHSTT